MVISPILYFGTDGRICILLHLYRVVYQFLYSFSVYICVFPHSFFSTYYCPFFFYSAVFPVPYSKSSNLSLRNNVNPVRNFPPLLPLPLSFLVNVAVRMIIHPIIIRKRYYHHHPLAPVDYPFLPKVCRTNPFRISINPLLR